ncbi:MAG: glycosyltransferase family 39 protein [Aggregatilineales bacterium]
MKVWLPVLVVALALRVIVLASGAVSFHSDEAIIALMARHINQGLPIPTFFYGQAYMGSLDAILVASGFRVFGEQVLTIRLVESALYLAIVSATTGLAFRLTGQAWIAIVTGLLVAIPPVTMTLYTTMTLGGYNETLLFGTLALWLGYDLSTDYPDSIGRWALLGAIAGLGWWTNGLIVVYLLPVTVYLLASLYRRFSARRIAIAFLCFVIGSLPWWLYNFNHNWDALHWLTGSLQSANGVVFGPGIRAFSLFFIGLPAAFGVRFSWQASWWSGIWSGPIIAIYVLALVIGVYRARKAAGAERYLLTLLIGFGVVFIVSAFGSDPSGRYFVPIMPILAMLLAIVAYELWQRVGRRRIVGTALIGSVLAFQLAGNVVAMTTIPPGITSQFDPANDFTNAYDQALIDFLLTHNATLGYGTYWVTFRIAFLSQERVILDAWLPNKESLIYTSVDRRYPPYTQAVEAAAHPVYVTANLPSLDAILVDKLAQAGITYQRQVIGPYTVYYDLSHRITPDVLGLELPPRLECSHNRLLLDDLWNVC